MLPWWADVLLVLTHVLLFAAGAICYHMIRVLAVRPFGPASAKPPISDAKLNEIAMKAAKLSTAADRFGPQFDPLPDVNILRRQIIPEGDGRSKEETFVPAK